MVKIYEHTQVGHLLIWVLSGVMVAIGILMVSIGFNWIAVTVLIILGVVLAMTASLTVTIRNDTLEVRFGRGPIRKRFRLRDIRACQVVRNPWYYGWGIHLTPDGWLYNVSGSQAVEISLVTGESYRIGSNVPQELAGAIREAAGLERP